jgi:aminopeptidase N
VPDFYAGAMENPGCVTFRDHFIYRGRTTKQIRGAGGIIAHEMAPVVRRPGHHALVGRPLAEQVLRGYLAHRCCSEATDYPLWTEFGCSEGLRPLPTRPRQPSGGGQRRGLTRQRYWDFDGISYHAKVRRCSSSWPRTWARRLSAAQGQRYGLPSASLGDLIDAWSAEGATGLDHWVWSWLRSTGMDAIDAAACHLRSR